MSSSKKYLGKTCVYCLDPGASSSPDHVIAREFFPVGERDRLPKVPSCEKCQTEKSRLEQYLIATLPLTSEHPSAALGRDMELARRRLKSNRPVERAVVDESRPVWMPTEGGVLALGRLAKFDGEMFEKLVPYIVRGLTWFHFDLLIPKGYCITVKFLPLGDIIEVFGRKPNPATNAVIDGVLAQGGFTYRCLYKLGDPTSAVWCMYFYDGANVVNDENLDAQLYACAGVDSPRA